MEFLNCRFVFFISVLDYYCSCHNTHDGIMCVCVSVLLVQLQSTFLLPLYKLHWIAIRLSLACCKISTQVTKRQWQYEENAKISIINCIELTFRQITQKGKSAFPICFNGYRFDRIGIDVQENRNWSVADVTVSHLNYNHRPFPPISSPFHSVYSMWLRCFAE